jgi:endogenous inhibitor of DNA gyrase (YacG/DUF329 family)
VTANDPPPRTVACPSCGKPAAYAASNRWRPFCSERCRINDLGAWAEESYRIPAKPGEDEIAGGVEDSEK